MSDPNNVILTVQIDSKQTPAQAASSTAPASAAKTPFVLSPAYHNSPAVDPENPNPVTPSSNRYLEWEYRYGKKDAEFMRKAHNERAKEIRQELKEEQREREHTERLNDNNWLHFERQRTNDQMDAINQGAAESQAMLRQDQKQFIKQHRKSPEEEGGDTDSFGDSSIFGMAAGRLSGSSSLGGMVGGSLGSKGGARLGAIGLAIGIRSEMNNAKSEATENRIQKFGEFLGGTGSQGLSSMARGAAGALDPIQQATGVNLFKLDDRMGHLISTVEALDGAISSLTTRYGEFSPDILRAQATAEQRDLALQMEGAARLGPGMARYNDASSRIDAEIERIRMILMEQIVPPIATVAESAATGIEIIGILAEKWDLGDTYLAPIGKLLEGLNSAVGDAGEILFGDLSEVLQDELQKRRMASGEIEKQINNFLRPGNAMRTMLDVTPQMPADVTRRY